MYVQPYRWDNNKDSIFPSSHIFSSFHSSFSATTCTPTYLVLFVRFNKWQSYGWPNVPIFSTTLLMLSMVPTTCQYHAKRCRQWKGQHWSMKTSWHTSKEKEVWSVKCEPTMATMTSAKSSANATRSRYGTTDHPLVWAFNTDRNHVHLWQKKCSERQNVKGQRVVNDF